MSSQQFDFGTFTKNVHEKDNDYKHGKWIAALKPNSKATMTSFLFSQCYSYG